MASSLSPESEALVQELDHLRYVDLRQAAIRSSAALVEATDIRLICRLLGVYGSTLRMQGRRKLAYAAIKLGLQLVRGTYDYQIQGDLLQRMAYLVSCDGEYQKALWYSADAIYAHGRGGGMVGVGKTLVDQAMFHYYLGAYEACRRANADALPLLPESEQRNRFTAYLSLSMASWKLGDSQQTLRACQEARRYASGAGGLVGNLEWHEATVHFDLGHLPQATKCYQAAFEALTSPIDVLLVGIGWIRALNALGRFAAGSKVAHLLTQVVFPLESQPAVVGALKELIRHGLEGEAVQDFTLQAVEKAIERAHERARKNH